MTKYAHTFLKLKRALLFTFIADEVTDLSNTEQLSLVLTYVDPDDGIVRDLLDFIECSTGITGRSLADEVLGALIGYGVNLSKLRGQAYGGAGNMSGPIRGMAALVAAVSNLPSFCLSLSLFGCCKILAINQHSKYDRSC